MASSAGFEEEKRVSSGKQNRSSTPDQQPTFESASQSDSDQTDKVEEKSIPEQKFDPNADFLCFEEEKPKINKGFEKTNDKYNREVNYPWLSDETLKVKDIHTQLHNEILDYVKWITPSKEDMDNRQSLVKRIKKVVKELYPDAVVMVFGSCATGLNLPNSDIDLLVYNPQVKELTMLNKLCNNLVKQIEVQSIEPLKFTKVPLIKLQEKNSKINVDISFNRTNGIYCVKLVKFLQKKYPELRPLILILKAFLKSRELNETYHGGVGSFLLTMLVTSFL